MDDWCAACGAPLYHAPKADWSTWDAARPPEDPLRADVDAAPGPDPSPEIEAADAPVGVTHGPAFVPLTEESPAPEREAAPGPTAPMAAAPDFIPLSQAAPARITTPAPPVPAVPEYRPLGVDAPAGEPDFIPLRASVIDEPDTMAPLSRLTAAVRALRDRRVSLR